MKTYSQHILEVSLKDFEKELEDPEIKAGYDAFIKSLKDGGNPNSDPGDSGDNSGNDADGNSKDQGDASGESASSGGGSGSGRGDGEQGVVTAADQAAPSGLKDVPGTPGSFFDKSIGDQIAEEEGYEKTAGNQSSVEKGWEEKSREAANQIKKAGKGAGWDVFVTKVNQINRSGKNWRNELRKVVGRSISPVDKRRAFVAKNPLVTQNRLQRTDKDKFDAVNYIMCWVDTSASMSEEFLNACISEVYQVAVQKKPLSIVIAQFDTRVADLQIFNNTMELKKKLGRFKIKGGGGTDVKCCFDMLKEDKRFSRSCAELVMIFTDGVLTQYKRDPKHMNNLCWVICDNESWELKYKDPFTSRIYLSNKDYK